MPFSNPIIGGNGTLVRDQMQSEGFVTGVTGWRIERNGNAEFNNLIARGELLVGDLATKYIHITNAPQPIINFGTPSNVEETLPASIDELATSFSSYLFLSSPERNSSGKVATVSLIADDTPLTQFSVSADESYFNSNFIRLGNSTTDKHLDLLYNAGDGMAEIRNPDETWNNITLQNSWVTDSGSTTPQYMKNANGEVWVRGAVKNGTTVVIGTLPVGYRPAGQVFFTPAQHAGTSTAASHIQVGTDGVLTITTNLVASQTRLRLGFSFPTFN